MTVTAESIINCFESRHGETQHIRVSPCFLPGALSKRQDLTLMPLFSRFRFLMFVWCVASGAATVVALLSSAGCAAQDAPRAGQSATNKQRSTEVDLSGAHLDKRKFLVGISMLGKLVEQDIEILRKITGHTFEPKQEEGALPKGDKQYTSFARYFKDSPLLINGRYEYLIYADGSYRPGISLSFNTSAVCYRVEDLESVFGPPARVVSAGEIPAKGLGPSHVWNVIYDYSWDARSVFTFATAVCASSVSIRPKNARGTK